MTAKERFRQTMEFGQPDRAPFYEWLLYWAKTVERWWEEGMPRGASWNELFGYDERDEVSLHLGIYPHWEEEILSDDGKIEVIRATDGVISRRFKDGSGSIPQFIKFPIETRDDWEEFKKRLDPKSPSRYPTDWDDRVKRFQSRDYPISIATGSLFGWIRNWMGLEGASITLMTDKAWVEEMMDYIVDFVIETITPALEQIPDIDLACFWEDMAYNKGSLIAPKYFKELMVPRYKRITEVLHKHGIKFIFVDCDGNHEELTPLWLESGVNGVYPLEITAGMDPVKCRKEYGKDLLMIGGMDKRVLSKDKAAIKEEVMSKVPWLVEQGGYIPSVDHSVPPDVPYENYQYYMGLMKEVIGVS